MPPATAIQFVSLAAVHGHPAAVVTETEAVPPPAGNGTDAGVTVYVHPEA
jgi:hypothetical protein